MRFSFLLLFITVQLCAQETNRDVLEADTFPSFVRSVKLINLGFSIDEESYAGDTVYDPHTVHFYSFDRKGQRSERLVFENGISSFDTSWMSADGLTRYEKSESEYDNELITTAYNADGTIRSVSYDLERHADFTISFEYRPDKKLSRKITNHVRSLSEEAYYYDKAGQLIRYTYSSTDNAAKQLQVVTEMQYTYDAAGFKTREVKLRYGSANKINTRDTLTFTYDSLGRVWYTKAVSSSTGERTTSVYGYTPEGRISAISYLTIYKGGTERDGEISYEYDAYGNWSRAGEMVRQEYSIVSTDRYWYTTYNERGLPVRCEYHNNEEEVSIYVWEYQYW